MESGLKAKVVSYEQSEHFYDLLQENFPNELREYGEIILAPLQLQRFGDYRGLSYKIDKYPKAADLVYIDGPTRIKKDQNNPKFWFIENPGGNGAMKQLPMMKEYPSTEIYYCQYGGKTKKPTSLFGQFPSQFIPKTVCSHINHKEGIIQMKGHLDRSEYPTDFCKDIVKSCKNSKLRSHTTLEEYL